MSILFGLLAGMALPMQTSINSRLREKLGQPYYASMTSFSVAFSFLALLLLFTGQSLFIPFQALSTEPFWIWLGGFCGVVFITSNILLFSRLGSVQTVVLPILGQILMGMIIDNFGFFRAQQQPFTLIRIAGAIFVITGTIMISMAKEIKKGKPNVELQELAKEGETFVQKEISADRKNTKQQRALWLWRGLGILAGVLSATQIAINGYLGRVIDSPIKAGAISCFVGAMTLLFISIVVRLKVGPNKTVGEKKKYPWWIWFGGIIGGTSVFLNVYLSGLIGTGMTVTLVVTGATTGGLLVDQFGLFGSAKKPINLMTVVGVVIMVIGAAAIKLF